MNFFQAGLFRSLGWSVLALNWACFKSNAAQFACPSDKDSLDTDLSHCLSLFDICFQPRSFEWNGVLQTSHLSLDLHSILQSLFDSQDTTVNLALQNHSEQRRQVGRQGESEAGSQAARQPGLYQKIRTPWKVRSAHLSLFSCIDSVWCSTPLTLLTLVQAWPGRAEAS